MELPSGQASGMAWHGCTAVRQWVGLGARVWGMCWAQSREFEMRLAGAGHECRFLG